MCGWIRPSSRRTCYGCERCDDRSGCRSTPVALIHDPLWYKTAVFYEVVIRGFYDSNNDGTGDIRGLLSKLDYLEWLGIDCIWLLPFFQSPLRDGGYDISDYMTVLPEYGSVDDVEELLTQAHNHGIRV